MALDKIIIKTESGENIEAIAPVIISASRSTDIPAFYGGVSKCKCHFENLTD